MFRLTVPLAVLAVVLAALTPACKKADAPPSTSASTTASSENEKLPPMPVVTDDATDLLFSYVDAQGHIVPVSKVADVPENVRTRVLVVDLKKSPEERQAHRYAFFVDLTAKDPEGKYPVSVVSRYDAARGQTQAPIAAAPEGSVVVYSATWCGFCKKAKAWLKENNVPFVDRDVEKTAGAQDELDEKLKKAGVPGGGIPVIDWAGQKLVMGFDQRALEELKRTHPVTATTGPSGTP